MIKEKVKISKLDKYLMSLFFSFLTLSIFFSLFFMTVDKIYDNIFMEQSFVEGVVSNYTSDYVYVDVDWVVEYKHSKYFTEKDKSEMKLFIIHIMKRDIENFIHQTTYKEYIELKKQTIIRESSNSRIIIFNNKDE